MAPPVLLTTSVIIRMIDGMKSAQNNTETKDYPLAKRVNKKFSC